MALRARAVTPANRFVYIWRMELAVETRGLSKTYKRGRVHALKALDLQVPVGSAFGLLGPNGAGKSTLVKTLMTIVRATSGSATLLGVDFRRPQARRQVGYLPEGHRFPSYLTGAGVCEYFGRLAGLRGAQLAAEIKEKLELVGMSEWADVKISRYSKGMVQRVGLAQAMLGNPRLIFLDEPTDGVDPLGRQEIREVIKRLCRQGSTIFLNSHLLSEVEQVCDRIAVMHHGRILRQGSVREIIDAVTGGQSALQVRFRTSDTGSARPLLDKRGGVTPTEDGFIVNLPGPQAVTPLIDELRSAKVEIFAVEPQHANLEEAFIRLIQQQSDQGVGGTR